jgi:hypothetical protein
MAAVSAARLRPRHHVFAPGSLPPVRLIRRASLASSDDGGFQNRCVLFDQKTSKSSGRIASANRQIHCKRTPAQARNRLHIRSASWWRSTLGEKLLGCGTTVEWSSAVSNPSKKSGSGHRRTGPRAPPRRNTSRSITGRNSCLGRGIRTVQRWEREEGLPVHRLAHEKRGSVYARREELTAWWESRRLTLAAPSTSDAVDSPVALRLERVTRTALVRRTPDCVCLGCWEGRRRRSGSSRLAARRCV